jgi:hypothetical protein
LIRPPQGRINFPCKRGKYGGVIILYAASLDLIDEKQLERVDFSAVPEAYGISFKLQKITYRAKVEMELCFAELMLSRPVLITEAEEYLSTLVQKDHYRAILDGIDEGRFCPEPAGGAEVVECALPNGGTYYSVRSLWDLLYVLNLYVLNKDWLRWREVYYLPGELSNYENRSYFDYNERGREFIMTEDVYFVEGIGRWVMVESCYDSY